MADLLVVTKAAKKAAYLDGKMVVRTAETTAQNWVVRSADCLAA